MKKLIVLSLIGLGATCNASAATWYGFVANSTKGARYFFDMDTVSKRPGVVTLWTKTVFNPNIPEADGIQATANKRNFDCQKRTVQGLIEVQYGKNGDHLKTMNKPMEASEAVPGSLGEGLLKVVCARDFPSTKSDDYVRVGDNDVFAATKRLFDSRDDPAPK